MQKRLRSLPKAMIAAFKFAIRSWGQFISLIIKPVGVKFWREVITAILD